MDRLTFSRRATSLLSLALALACGDSTSPPTTGTISLSVVTTGVDLDPDGYWLVVDGGEPLRIATNGTTTWNGDAGLHRLTVSGIAFNCDSTPPSSATIAGGDTTRVEVRLACAPFLQNAIVYLSDAAGNSRIMVMNADGSRRQPLTDEQSVYSAPAISPDGQTIAAAAWSGTWNSIYLLDRFGQARRKLVGLSNFDGSPAWSPDGEKIAFRSEITDSVATYDRIFVVNQDGTGVRQLTTDSIPWSFDDAPAWSPDGTHVLYTRDGVLQLIGADGSGAKSLGVSGMHPGWSPDGARIAFEWWVDNRYTAIFVADRDGGNARQITFDTESDQYPRWSPDGREITFQRVVGGVFHIYRIAPDGTGLTRLSIASNSNEDNASWGPAVVAPAPALLAHATR